MAYVRKFRGGWRAEVQKKGVRRTAVWPTKTQAANWAKKIEAEIEAGFVDDSQTFAQAADRYIKQVTSRKRGKGPETRRLHATVPMFPERLKDIRQSDIAAWRDTRLQTVSASTVVREANTLKHLFKLARKEWRWMDHDPWDGVKLPRHDPPRHQRWGWREIVRMLKTLGYRQGQTPRTKSQEVALAFMISLRTALRAGEVLQVSPVNVRKNVLTLRDTKTEKFAQVPLTRRGAALCSLVRQWTITPQTLDALFRKAREKCMLDDLRFHDARATALTFLARKVDVLTLSRISRHKDLKMLSEVYYRESAEEIARRLK